MPDNPADNIDAALAAARAHQIAGRLAEAEAICGEILADRPDHIGGLNLLGTLLRQSRRLDGAIEALRKSVELNPNQAEAHAELGVCLIQARNPAAAVEACRKAIAIDPTLAAAYNNLGACLRFLGHYEEAAAACRKAIEIRPDHARAMTNLGAALAELGRNAEAVELHSRAIELEPNLNEAHWNLAMASLRLGDLKRGFSEYEWRFKGPDGVNLSRYSQPRWDGGDLAGKTILLHGEQGMGDIIQFVRYVPLVAAKKGKIILVCHPELCRLLGNMRFVSRAIGFEATPPHHDVYCPTLSLPFVFGTTQVTIPAYTPYIHPAADLVRVWGQRLGPRGTTARVGLVWSGRPEFKDNAARSIRLEQLAPLAEVKGIEFHSLQKGPASREALNPPAGMRLIDHSERLTDFAETAALIANLDLIISVDTAPAHLAGAVGKPVWVLLHNPADWRWMLQRSDNPWYPTMVLFRQTAPGQWNDVIGWVAQGLATGQRRAPAV
jgi:Flp pilus assembly protein TadD